MSDHLPIIISIDCGVSRSHSSSNLIKSRYVMSEKNYKKFEIIIKNENWSELGKEQISQLSPHDAYNIFLKKFKDSFERAFLLRNNNNTINSNQKRSLLPWLTDSLIRSCRKKFRLLKIYKKTGTVIARNKYVKYKNILKQTLRHEEKIYYEN